MDIRSETLDFISRDGAFSRLCAGYEYRPQQLQMARAVADVLVNKGRLLVEAGTGVGKTVAYLTPAILHALDSERPVVISTHTLNLQSQLLGKDIPMLQAAMPDHPFTAVVMKGRSNFVCLKELDHASESTLFSDDLGFKHLCAWAAASDTGEFQDLDFQFSEWGEVCGNPDTCKRQDCTYYDNRCFYYKMRKRAAAADIIVVNHALFFADLSIRQVDRKNAIIPTYSGVIFDEAHHLEDVATDAFGVELSNHRIPWLINRLKKRSDVAVSASELGMLDAANKELFSLFESMPKQEYFLEELGTSIRLERVVELGEQLGEMVEGLRKELNAQDTDGNPQLKDRIEGYCKMLAHVNDDLDGVIFGANPGYFKWCEKTSGSRFVNTYLHYTPVNVGEILGTMLWDTVDTVICTSATLANSGTFDYLRSRLGVYEADEVILGSPFDFKKRAILYVPRDLPQPSEKREYADQVSARIKELLMAVNGRAFLLFTSYRMLNSVFERLIDNIPFRLLKQGEMSNERLLKEFRENDDTCLMGVHSFWEGVDVKGERLTCVVIDKLPFAVPDSPVVKARCREIEESGGNSFADYSVPQAQIRLKQGFGRLIRTKTDYGVVAILDSRIHTKFYGKQFVKYLPDSRRTTELTAVVEFLKEFAE